MFSFYYRFSFLNSILFETILSTKKRESETFSSDNKKMIKICPNSYRYRFYNLLLSYFNLLFFYFFSHPSSSLLTLSFSSSYENDSLHKRWYWALSQHTTKRSLTTNFFFFIHFPFLIWHLFVVFSIFTFHVDSKDFLLHKHTTRPTMTTKIPSLSFLTFDVYLSRNFLSSLELKSKKTKLEKESLFTSKKNKIK